jgi:hypothetical protein
MQITFNASTTRSRHGRRTGRRIVFARDFDPIRGQVDFDLFTMNADGTDQRNLTNTLGIQDRHPTWWPDGRRIAFESDRDGDTEVYTMRPNGSSVRQLTFNAGSTSPATKAAHGLSLAGRGSRTPRPSPRPSDRRRRHARIRQKTTDTANEHGGCPGGSARREPWLAAESCCY